ncbi:class I SAM-dependent methyltransferase [Nocardia australiensis]|uniref:class I SAM-dependent methyltransferase n=1 Tax=Nocardia australiensis TaxID=2887191 RepID=UPI001D1569BD|nr:class I SAM-dependent methyltransferase [Nocardia australiensis]
MGSAVTQVDGAILAEVPETALLTLRCRACEAVRPDSPFTDSLAVQVYDTIDYPFERFGRPSQLHALRALAFDAAITDFVTRHHGATVVALGEGLQTTYWRLNNPAIKQWVSVDLPEMIALREELLPREDNIENLTMSALDRTWMDRVDADHGVFISAEGLFPYLDRADVFALIADCARRFPGGQLMFDSVPRWVGKRSAMRLTAPGGDHVMPHVPFHLSAAEALLIPSQIYAVAAATEITTAPGRGLWAKTSAALSSRIPYLANLRTSITLLDFEHSY